MFEIKEKTITCSNGHDIKIETGRVARQADGAVLISCGKTMLIATVVSSKTPREDVAFFPLSVDYQEKFAASGKIPGGFLKREGKLSDYEVLICRLVDRAIRPLFPDDYLLDTQVMISLVSYDENIPPDSLAALAASSAISVSDIPFLEPVSEVRVAKINGEYCINPSHEELKNAELQLIVAASKDNILMVEGEMKECSEEEMVEAMKFAHDEIKKHCQIQLELKEELGKSTPREYPTPEEDKELFEELSAKYYPKYFDVFKQHIKNKHERKKLLKAIAIEYFESLPEEHEVNESMVSRYFGKIEKKAARDLVLNDNIRIDQRQFDEIRNIDCVIDILPTAHGSALFTRGETQSLTTTTIGTKLDNQMIDGAVLSGTNQFILHYNFPGFSTGEVKPNRGASRREVGHGNLAGRALKAVLPDLDENPYTIRIVSDILESNGSSSMATVCAGTLSLMDAGIQITNPVSGIAMGMISDPETGKFAILSDILGDEDHLGDMDFKVTGTKNGITACQMDIKVEGLSYEVLTKALQQAKKGREHILEVMSKTISEPNPEFKEHVPQAHTIKIKKDLIGAIIGPGGKVIQELQATTSSTISISEVENQGIINIYSANKQNLKDAIDKINAIVEEPEVGNVYKGIVKAVKEFGAFVEFLPGKQGLLHISEISKERLNSMDGIYDIGDEVEVKLVNIDKKTGKYRLSHKVLLN